MRLYRLKEVLLGLLSGFFLYLAFSKYNLFLLGFVGLVIALRGGSFRFLLAGLVFFSLSLKWLYLPLVKYGGVNPLIGYLSVALLILFLFVYQFGLTYFLWSLLGKRWELFPLIYVSVELARSLFPYGGFPWLILGGLILDVPVLRQVIGMGSVYGGSLFVLYLCILPLLRVPFRKAFLAVTVLLAVSGIYQEIKPLPPEKGLKVAVVQTNIPEDVKLNPYLFEKSYPSILEQLEEAVSQRPDLVILPESAVPFFLEQLEERGKEILELSHKAHIILGIVEIGGPYNSVVHLFQGKVLGIYRKSILVPFGEYTPSPFKIFSSLVPYLSMSDYARGEGPVCFRAGCVTLGTPICFEVAYNFYIRSFPCEVIAVLTNDAWFEDTDGTYQHFKLARIRALEEGKYFLWVNNTGPSAVISPRGEPLKVIDYGVKGILFFTL